MLRRKARLDSGTFADSLTKPGLNTQISTTFDLIYIGTFGR